MGDEHTPVLAAEALAGLALEADGYYVDATFGRGGHTALILQALGREGRLLAIDRDPQAIAAGAERFADEVRLALVHASFADLGALVPLHAEGRACRGVLFDLGVSSPQLDDARRGPRDRRDAAHRGAHPHGAARGAGRARRAHARARQASGDAHLSGAAHV